MDVVTECPICENKTVVRVNQKAYENWKNGMCIQVAMPKLSADKREMLKTGICPKCWDELFKEG